MTREEAARMCEAVVKPTFGTISSNDNNDAYKEAFEMAIAALRGPQPDPITGLVPCGCGGKPANEDFFDGFFHLSRVTCPKCGIEVTTADGQAKAAWNHAMGMLEVEG